MNKNKTSSVVGFLMALSALNAPLASAKSPVANNNFTIDSRIEAIANTIKEKESQLHNSSSLDSSKVKFLEGIELAGFSNWNNGSGRGFGWRNNNWRDGGRFLNWWN